MSHSVPPDPIDTRTAEQREADGEVAKLAERGEFLSVAPTQRAEAVRRVKERYERQRELAARLGLSLGALRRSLGVSQGSVAEVVGTQRSNISRIENGRYGGISLERFLGMIHALESESKLSLMTAIGRQSAGTVSVLISEPALTAIRSPADCIEAA